MCRRGGIRRGSSRCRCSSTRRTGSARHDHEPCSESSHLAWVWALRQLAPRCASGRRGCATRSALLHGSDAMALCTNSSEHLVAVVVRIADVIDLSRDERAVVRVAELAHALIARHDPRANAARYTAASSPGGHTYILRWTLPRAGLAHQPPGRRNPGLPRRRHPKRLLR